MSALYVGLATLLPKNILINIYPLFSVISTADLSENDNILKTQFDINLPIKGLFCQNQDAIYLPNAGGAPYTPLQILNMAYQLAFQSVILAKECHIWKRRPAP